MKLFMRTKCIEGTSPQRLSSLVNRFIEQHKDIDPIIDWQHVDFCGRITFFAYIVYYTDVERETE